MKILGFIFICVSICHGGESYADSWKSIHSQGILRIGFDASYYPLTFYNKHHKVMGIDVEIASILARKMNVRIRWIAQNRNKLIDGLQANRYDIIWSGFAMNQERAKKILFSIPYYRDNKRIILKFESGKKIKTICNFKVGYQLGTTAELVGSRIKCPAHEKIKFMGYVSNDQAFKDLNGHKIQAIIMDTISGLYYSSTHPKVYRMFEHPISKPEYKAIAFNIHDKNLKNHVNKVLRQLINNGKIHKIFKAWKYNNVFF